MTSEYPLTILTGDALQTLTTLPDESVHCCVTSPPYWGLRDYGVAGQLGLERTPEDYVSAMVAVFREVRRMLRQDGTCWVNLGDAYAHNGACGGGSPVDNATDARGPRPTRFRDGDRKIQEAMRYRVPPGLKPKDLVGIPWRVAFALQADGWWLRQDIIWHKPNPMPESVTDRCTKAHEYLFLLSKSARYWYDGEAIAEPAQIRDDERPFSERDSGDHGQGGRSYAPRSYNGSSFTKGKTALNGERANVGQGPRTDKATRNRRSVWTIPTAPYPEAHFATYPADLVKPCILAGCPPGGTVLDPFAGSGTTGMVALELGRKAILIELNPDYVELIRKRCNVTPGFAL